MRKIAERVLMNKNCNCLFSDVIGYESEKEELREVQKFIVEREKYNEIGARAPKGILLVGESGNGKTMMARALANEINIPFYAVGSDEDENEQVMSLRNIFKEAKKNSPCVVFIDELDKFNPDEMYSGMIMGGETSESPLIRELLTQMDGFESNEGVIVIATANSTRNLNKTLFRSGRFDRTIEFRNPNLNERELLFKYYASSKKMDESIDFHKLAIRTPGVCCADIDNIINEASLLSVRNNQEKVQMSDIENSIDRVTLKCANENKLSEEARIQIATHEIGHALVDILKNKKNNVSKISIVSRGDKGGFTRFMRFNRDEDEFGFTCKSEMYNDVIKSLGGMAAEEVYLNDITTGAYEDISQAKHIIDSMINAFGMYGITFASGASMFSIERGISEKKKSKQERIVDGLLNNAHRKAKALLRANRPLYETLLSKLLENNVLYKEEIDEILTNYNSKKGNK